MRLFVTYMREKIKRLSATPKKYLEWAGFDVYEQKAKFVRRSFADVIVALIYSSVSILLIVMQQADIIVLGLNILCLFRALISNTVSASEVTIKKNQLSDIEKKHERNSHYHNKARILATLLFFIVIIWWVLIYEKNFSTLLIKIFAGIAIFAVFLNDCEDNVVYAYNASIEAIYRREG